MYLYMIWITTNEIVECCVQAQEPALLHKKTTNCIWIYPFKGPFTPSESESEKDQRAGKRDQRKNFKHQRKFQLSFLLSLDVNGL